MGKIYRGYELIETIAKGKIEENTKFKHADFYDGIIYKNGYLALDSENEGYPAIDIFSKLNSYFEENVNENIKNGIKKDLIIHMNTLNSILPKKVTLEKNNKDNFNYNKDLKQMAANQNLLINIVNNLENRIKILENSEKEYCDNCGIELTKENKYMDGMCIECKCGIDWKNAQKNWKENFEQ